MKRLSNQELVKCLNQTDKGREYLTKITEYKNRNLSLKKEKGFEIHHIHPRKLGGLSDKSNLLKVSVFEHCCLHALLAFAIPCYETLQPIVLLSNHQILSLSDLEQTSLEDLYQWSQLREKALHQPKSEVWRKATIAANTGRVISDTTRKKMRDSHLGQKHRTNNGQVWVYNGVEERLVSLKVLDDLIKGGWIRGRKTAGKPRNTFGYRHSSETKAKISLANTGKVRSREAVERQIKTRKKLGLNQISEESKQKISKSNKGRIYINNGIEVRAVKENQIQKYLDLGWVRGRKG